MRALLSIWLLFALPATATAGPVLHAAAQAGVSSPAGRFDNALTYGLTAGVHTDARLGGQLSILRASHAVQDSPLDILTTSLTLGPVLEVDRLPVAPFISVGPALQLASRSDSPELFFIPGGYAAIGLRARLFTHLHAAAQLQYLTSAFSSEVFPAYTSLVVQVGGALPL